MTASAWPWAFALLAAVALLLVGLLAWQLGRWQTRAADQAAGATTRVPAAAAPAAAEPAPAGPALTAPPAPGRATEPAALSLLAAALDLQAEPALLLAHDAAGSPRLRHLNAAASVQLPQAQPGDSADTLAPLAAALQAVAALGLGTRGEHAGWRLARIGLPAPDTEAWLLLAGSPAPDADTETEQFSFTLSHDLRAPIRVVEGFTRIVKEDYGELLDRVGNEHLDRVLGAAARMNLMIDALLTLARLSRQPLSRQRVNLSQLATWVGEELRRGAPERQVQFEIEAGLQVTGDPTLLRMLLENLIGNAWKYSSRNESSLIRFGRVPHAGGLAYRVQDNGAGFDMRGAERLFGLFQRLHSASEFPGTGVGLASVRRIVQRHGGQIWAEAEPGRGASFYFTLAEG